MIAPRQPSYRRHKPTNQAVVTIDGKDVYLGKFKSQASRAEYDRVISEWLANGRKMPTGAVVTIAEVITQFWAWAEQHYRHADGRQTSEIWQYRSCLRPLNYLYGELPAKDFGPLKLTAVRQLMVDGYEHPKHGSQRPWARRVINKAINRLKFVFRWAVAKELIPAAVRDSLNHVLPLERGRSEARETKPVHPVAMHMVDEIRPHIGRHVEALIDLQLFTAARPGELVIMRACDIDMTGRIWVYKPAAHKNEHREHSREIFLGPRAQEIVKPLLKTDVQAYLFNAIDAEAERQQARRRNRKTPLYASHAKRLDAKRKKNRRRAPRDHYDVAAYRHAIARACDKAFPLPEHLDRQVIDGKRESEANWKARLTPDEKAAIKKWRQDHQWNPHQLRHNAGTNIRKEFGVELARIILGHATAFTTEIYAEADKAQAMEIIGKIG